MQHRPAYRQAIWRPAALSITRGALSMGVKRLHVPIMRTNLSSYFQ